MRSKTKFSLTKVSASFGLALLLILVLTQSAMAHTSVVDGEFEIFALWVNEPVIAGERNTLAIEISRNGNPIARALAKLEMSLAAGGVEKAVVAVPKSTSATLRYEITFIPTDPGEYTVTLEGTIDGEPIAVSIAPEEVNPATILLFPDQSVFNNRTLQDILIDVEARTVRAEQRGNIGIGLGVFALVIAIGGIVLSRQKNPDK